VEDGDLVAEIRIMVPKKLTKKETEVYEKLKELALK